MNLLDFILPADMAEAILEFDAGMAKFPFTFIGAYKHFLAAAKLGHPGGLYMVGKCHMYGHGVAQSDKVAQAYLQAAFQRGHNRAGFILAVFYHRNDDPLTGDSYYIKAADLGEFDSQMHLANSYKQGINGFALNRQKALHYYLMAARNPNGRPMEGKAGVKQLDRALWQAEFAQPLKPAKTKRKRQLADA